MAMSTDNPETTASVTIGALGYPKVKIYLKSRHSASTFVLKQSQVTRQAF